jgi:hypothetical protein
MPDLNLYLVKRTDEYGYDESVSYVAAAEDENVARKLGQHLTGDQPWSIWWAPTTLVIKIGTAGPGATEPFVIHEHYR